MVIVSKLLGHSRMGITQAYYGKILEEKVSEVLKRLKEELVQAQDKKQLYRRK